MKNEKGITLIALTVAVAIMIIISSMLIYNAKNGIKIRNLKMMQNDIEILDDKINAYYVKYEALPIEIKYIGTFPENFEAGANDGEEYYVIDLKALVGITLNYGLDFNNIKSEEDTKTYSDVYIINKNSHAIYYPHGIVLDGVSYYSNAKNEGIITKIIPKLALEETGEKDVKLILTTINGSKTEYNYKIYVKDTETGNAKIIKSGRTNEGTIETDEFETFFDIGIQDAYSIIEYEGGTVETNHVTKEDLKIKYKEELESFRDKVNGGKTYEGKTITQIANIDLQGSSSNKWTPIGIAETQCFKGIYEGRNHNIQNLYINTTLDYQGLFGYNKGNIKNLGIESGSIAGGKKYTGALIGYNEGGMIENCYNKININATGTSIGGICGNNQTGTIRQCYNLGNLSGTITEEYGGTYGIAGSIPLNDSDERIIEMCYNKGNIKTESGEHNTRAAGIGEGSRFKTTSVSIIRQCYNTGEITNIFTADSTYQPFPVSAGIAGQVEGENSRVESCYNIGKITVTAKYESFKVREAGIAGCRVQENSAIDNCYYLQGTAKREYGYGSATAVAGIYNQPEKIGTPQTVEEMKNLTSKLGIGFKEDTNSINNGYPILNWQ